MSLKGPLFAALALLLTVTGAVRADNIALRPVHPERYTVVTGDTLWGIAARFLENPWDWPKVWRRNPQIKNPQLIYPGDVIALHYVNGRPALTLERAATAAASKAPTSARPTAVSAPSAAAAAVVAAPAPGQRVVKLSPQVEIEPLQQAIPTIPPDAIQAFLTHPLVVTKEEMAHAGYVVVARGDRLILGDHNEFYARGLGAARPTHYRIVRPGRAIRDPGTREVLGYRAEYLGEARLLARGHLPRLIVTQVKREISPGDRLLPAPAPAPLPYYYPRAPKTPVHGRIVWARNSLSGNGPFTVVAINLGTRQGMVAGDVLRIMHHARAAEDPVTGRDVAIPEERSGLLMVFRPYAKLSFALVMNASRPVRVRDRVTTP